MSENECRAERDFSRFDSMSTEELQQILRQDALQENTESDTEKILYITEVLAKREKERDPGTGVQRAYRSFVQNYMPANDTNAPKKPAFFFSSMPRWLRSVAVLAAVLGLLLMGTAGADAMGFDLFGMVANWTAEVFHFSDATDGTEYTEPDQGSETELKGLQEALDTYNITLKLAPTWMPDGFQQQEVEVLDNPFEVSIYSVYVNADRNIQISIRQLIGEKPEQIEKDEGFVEIYEVNDVAYYIFQNNERVHTMWIINEYECLIAGNLTIAEIKEMIDSI